MNPTGTNEEQYEQLRDQITERLRCNPLLFGYIYCTGYFRDKSAWFHIDLVRDAMLCRRLGIAAPRESSKSTLVGFLYVLHSAVFKRKRHIILLQNNLSKAALTLYGIKHQLKNNKKLVDDFGITITKDTTEEIIIRHLDGDECRIVCKGHEQMGSIRGERFNEWRPDLIVIDDIEDDEMVKNPDRRRDMQAVFDEAVEPSVDRKCGQIVFIGTVLHDDSLISKIVGTDFYKDYKKLFFQARLGGRDGTSLWPQKWTVDDLNKIEDDNPEKFWKEYQNNPIGGARQKFQRSDFRYWTQLDNRLVLYGPDNAVAKVYETNQCVAAIGCDMAWEEKRENDFTVIAPLLLTPDSEVLVDSYICKKGMRPDEFEEIIFSMVAKYEKMTGSTVKLGFEKAKLEKVMKWFLSRAMRRRNKFLIMKDVRWDGDKITRIVNRLSPRYVNHTIFHLRGMGDFEYQLLRLPSGTHDDIPDAVQIAESLLDYPKRGKKVEVKESEFDWYRNLAVKNSTKVKTKSGTDYLFGKKKSSFTFPFATQKSFR